MAIDLLEQISPHIKNSIFPVQISLQDWKMKEGDIPDGASVSLVDKSWTSIRVPFQWGKFDRTCWFRQTLTVTQEISGKPLVILLDFPEALLYLNGKPHHGIDHLHKEILICEKSKLGEIFHIAIQAYSGRKHDHNNFSYAKLAVLDTTARRLDSGLNVLQDVEKLMEHGSQESKDIRDLIHRTLVFLKYFKPGSEEYPNAIRRAYNFLLNTLETELKTASPIVVHMIGQSHIDTAWLWTLKETARKCSRTFSSMLRLMEEFPEFRFSQGQPALYEIVKTNYPDLYKQIKQRVIEGKWEPLGAMWTEANCMIPNGESLVRQIVFGKRFIKQEFGIDANTCWLPDSFGFNWAMPQILKKSGVPFFYTSKLNINDTTKFPHNSFWWQGIDKTKILVHISPVGLEGQVTPKSILKSAEQSDNQQTTFPILQTFGSDNCGGATKENLESAVILKTLNGLPISQLSTVQDFFKQLELQSAELPTWENELYLETHRGTYSTQAFVKKENRECETLLYTTELLSTIALFFGKNSASRKYRKSDLDQAWKKLLLNQFEKIISGISISDVYKDTHQQYQEIKTLCSSAIDNSINGISQPVNKSKTEFHFSLFNPSCWTRADYIEFSVKSNEKNFSIVDSDGNSIIYQIIEYTKHEQKLLCYVENIPATGFKHVIVRSIKNTEERLEPWTAGSHDLETPFFRVRIDKKGNFKSLYAKHLRRDLFQKGKHGNFLATFRDTPRQLEAWNIDADYEKHKIDNLKIKQIKILEQGPLRANIHVEFKTENGTIISQNVYLYHKSSRIDFQTFIRWQEKQTLLKATFPFNIKTSSAVYGIQFGAINRSSKPHTDWEKAKFEVPAQQWADMSDAKYGISLLNDCKFGYDAKENTLRLTLLRSQHFPNPIDSSHPDKEFTDQGEHSFRYALYPHSGDWKKGETVRHANEFSNPIMIFPNVKVQEIAGFVNCSKSNIVIDAIKKAEESDAVIMRLHEAHGITTDSAFHFGVGFKSAYECDLLENEEKQLKVDKSKLHLKFKPFEIKTIKLTLKVIKKKP